MFCDPPPPAKLKQFVGLITSQLLVSQKYEFKSQLCPNELYSLDEFISPLSISDSSSIK